jgi:hypothetical protein
MGGRRIVGHLLAARPQLGRRTRVSSSFVARGGRDADRALKKGFAAKEPGEANGVECETERSLSLPALQLLYSGAAFIAPCGRLRR